MSWTLSDLRTKFRSLTARPGTAQLTDDEIDVYINDYYQQDLPLVISVDKILADWTQEATVTDDGEYSLENTTLDLNEPLTANGDLLVIRRDRRRFFEEYPIYGSEEFITAPTLVSGTTSAAAVANSAFKYKIADWTYSKAAGETDLSGVPIPQNKYGAWFLSIDSDGTIRNTEAGDNATGYDTAALAVNGLPASEADEAVMGFVTAISADSGGFVPGTTELSASAVTDTYTDGDPGLRNIPSDVCITDGKLFIRPKCNDTYLVRAKSSLSSPTALSADDDTPSDENWGLLIAMGAAIRLLSEKGETERRDKLLGSPALPGTYVYEEMLVNRKRLKQNALRECYRSF